jgi:hypothetical protein
VRSLSYLRCGVLLAQVESATAVTWLFRGQDFVLGREPGLVIQPYRWGHEIVTEAGLEAPVATLEFR